MVQAYCVKCRAKKEMKDAKAITMKNGKPATQGMCPTCGTKMFRIGKGQVYSDIAQQNSEGLDIPYIGMSSPFILRITHSKLMCNGEQSGHLLPGSTKYYFVK